MATKLKLPHWRRQYDHIAPLTGQQIRKIRKRLELSQWAFAHMIGTTQTSVSSWETGRQKPSRAMRQRIYEIVQHSDDLGRFTTLYDQEVGK